MEKKKRTDQSPTPELGKPLVRNKVFTYSENQLLDQLTLEITERWNKDLRLIGQIYRRSENLLNTMKDIEEKFPAFERFIQSNDLLLDFRNIKEYVQNLDNRQSEMNKMIFELEKRLDFKYVKSLQKSIEYITSMIESLQKKKSFWKRLSQRFRGLS